MFKNQLFRRVLTCALLGAYFLAIPMSANAGRVTKRAKITAAPTNPILGAIAAFAAYFVAPALPAHPAPMPQPWLQQNENEAPEGSTDGEEGEDEEAEKPGTPKRVVLKRPLASVDANSPAHSTPVRGKKRKTTSFFTPQRSLVRVDEDGRQLKLSPWTKKISDCVYVIHPEHVDFERYDLEGVLLSEDEIVALIENILEATVHTGMFDGGFYIGRARDPKSRSLGHLKDLQDEFTRKGSAFGIDQDEEVPPVMQGFFENAHPTQQHLLEGLMNLATRAYTGKAANCQSASRAAKDLFRRRLKDRADLIWERHKEDLRAREELLTEYCGPSSPSRFPHSDDDDESGGGSDRSTSSSFSALGSQVPVFSGF